MNETTTRPAVIGPRQVWNAWIRLHGSDRCCAAMERRPVGDAERDRHSLFWALRHCCDYQPSLPELGKLTGYAHSVVARCVANFERVATADERGVLRAELRRIAGGTR